MKNLPWLLAAIFGISSFVLYGQVNTAKHEASEAQTQLSDTQSKLTDLQMQLTDTQSQLSEAQGKLTDVQQQVDANAKPELHFRAGWTDPTDGTDMHPSVTLYNEEDTDETISISVIRPNGPSTNQSNIVVPKNGSYLLTLPNWTFIPGDVMTVSDPGHKDGQFTVPSS